MGYVQDAIDVAATLAEDGMKVILRRIVAGDHDPATSRVSTRNQDFTRSALVLDYGWAGSGRQAPEGVQQGDKQVYMEVGVVPMLKDRVIIGSINYGIQGIKELSPGGIPIMYELHLRQG